MFSSTILCKFSTRRSPFPRSCKLYRCLQRQQTTNAKPFYITTPIFYVNAKPHVGHLYTLVLTDVIRRYADFQGRQTFLLTGTDEHGMKIQAAAKSANKDPQDFCDEISAVFKELPAKADVTYDQFIRTTSAEHKSAVAHFWNLLSDNGYIFKAKHVGWYSISDETFFPETAIERRVHDRTGQVSYISTETGNVVKWTEEENYHFRLSSVRDKLIDFYKANPAFIIPQSRYDDVLSSVREGLQDLSISRPKSRLTWGIPVPGDDSQTIYVWLDALVNYLSATGYPETNSNLWPADYHVVGKDIIRFHCIYWPAFLLAAGLEPPKQVLSHAHWTLGNFKMSKSRGNVVDPWQAIERFGADTIRYYLMRDGRLENDGNYSPEHVILRHNHELVNGLGNLVARVTAKTFDLHGILTEMDGKALENEACRTAYDQIARSVDSYHENMQTCQVFKAVADACEIQSTANGLVQSQEPWTPTCSVETRRETLFVGVEAARIVALLLQPVMPRAMAVLLDRLGVSPTARGSRDAVLRGDAAYRPIREKLPHLFTAIDDGSSPKKIGKRK